MAELMKGTVGKQATLQPPFGPPSHWLVGLGDSSVWAGHRFAARIQSWSVGGKASLSLHRAHGGWKHDLGLLSLR